MIARPIRRALAAALALVAVGYGPAQADAVADFYRGRTVNLVIGYAPGGGYDLYARTLARHIGRHIPGQPHIVVQNMPGAGSIEAANFLSTIAPKDGATFGGFARGVFLDPLLGRGEGTQYDASKFGWLGSISNEVGVCAFRAAAGIKSWPDMRSKPFVIGSTGAGADSDVFPTVLRKMFRLPMKIVAGYGSAAEIVVAIKRSEVDGRCGWSWSSLVSWNRDMYEGKEIDVVLQLAAAKLDELAHVPLLTDVAETAEQRTALKLIVSRQTMARPYVAPPGIPAERVKALRDAFNATMKDPEFLAETGKLQLNIDPTPGEEMERIVREAYALPEPIVQKVRKALTE